jgi:hypothetical protein
MAVGINYINDLFIKSINLMAGSDWSWPEQWDDERKLKFLSDALKYSESNEFYEQCSIIRDVENEFKK